ncbi:M20 family metallopeptidase [Virgibacillus sp. NKC19-3]|uniref:M20 family metallopeptidase n=1 Tax=Virgibacillus saliphilus TaxID=2831674 RepID=UPI001C9B8B11|nr:M20 family metallopeptidase [Virgibacillus sp. NKC19-3]MBY7144929.1 M20 family metallopeptidase [Virgibacillus sp. NKC19-3]
MQEFEEKHVNEMLEMLEKLVNTDSGSTDKAGVDRVGEILCQNYEQIGFVPKVHKSEQYGNSITLRHQDATNPDILIVAHMDTVFPAGTASERPFTIRDGKAYGPGVIDMQASQVMVFYTMKALVEQQISAYKHVEIVLNSDEELGTISSRSLIEEKAKGKKAALVVEPAREDGSVVSSRRGSGVYELHIKGRAAHSGMNPENGINAIEELAHKILAFQSLSDPDNGLHVNVGLIEGGTSVNTIAPSAKASVDVRISTASQGKTIDEQIQAIGQQNVLDGIELTLTGGINRPPMELTDGVQKLVDIVQTKAQALGLNVGHTATGGGSDASFTAAMNVPTIDGLGPVGGKQHSSEEYLIVDSLQERMMLFCNVLQQLSEE